MWIIYHERIGDTEYEIIEQKLDVFSEVALWAKNPRLQPYVGTGTQFAGDTDLEKFLQQTNGYDTLLKSIADLGQMEAIYCWKGEGMDRYLTLEGATRVTILRDLARKHKNQPSAGRYNFVRAKILPAHFDEVARVILLARIHVRGSGVRSWGRYIEAKFVFDHTETGQPGSMSVSDLAKHMGKSVSWVSRLRDAYKFARSFVEHIDNDQADTMAARHFSTLEEISKSTGFGPKVRDYDNPAAESLRAEVFDMVQKDVFKEYRDARFMRQFHDDPEKWAQLQQGGKHVAHKLATEISAGNTSLKAKIEGLEQQIARALEREPDAIDESDIEHLRKALELAESRIHVDVRPFQVALVNFTRALENASLEDVRVITRAQFDELQVGRGDLAERAQKHNKAWGAKDG
jgi:hypothetical protein